MTRGLNKVMMIGRVGRDPEMRYTPSGRPVTNFSIGTTRTWNTADGERRMETEWFNIVVWSNKHSATEIVASEMILLDERRDNLQASVEFEEDDEELFN
jgi:primosomal replication protein N